MLDEMADQQSGDEQTQFTWSTEPKGLAKLFVGKGKRQDIESGRNLRVSVFSWGFRWVNADKELSGRWDEVAELRQGASRTLAYGTIPGPTTYQYWVVLADGRACTFIGVLGVAASRASAQVSLRVTPGVTTAVTIEQLGRIFRARVTSVLLPKAISRFNAGQSISFGPLTVGPAGITAGDESVTWAEVQDVQTRSGFVNVKKAGQWRAWSKVVVAQIPNYFVFNALVRAVLAQRVASRRVL
jgi:hypothetical protein